MADERRGERLDGVEAAVLRRWEELGDVQVELERADDLARGDGSGEHGNVALDARRDDLVIEAGAHDELGTGFDGLGELAHGEHRASAHAHIGLGSLHSADGIDGAIRAERDLGGLHARGHKRVRERRGVLDLLQHHDRHDAELLKLLVKRFLHELFLPGTCAG